MLELRFILLLLALSVPASAYDLVINNGRVMDPETGLNAILNVAIEDGSIRAVSADNLESDTVIDAQGLVVAPGFIDLHTHSPTQLGQYYQLFDGVTTALELEAGHYPASDYGVDGETSVSPFGLFRHSPKALNPSTCVH